MSLEERAHEGRVWISRIFDEQERAKIVEEAWRSVVGAEIQSEQEILKINSSLREAKAALAHMEAMHPGSLQKTGHAIEVQANAQLEVERLTERYNLSQYSLSVLSAKSDEQEAAIATYQAELADLSGRLAEWKTTVEAQAHAQLELERLTALYNLSQQDLSLLTAKTAVQEGAITAYQADLADLNGRLAERKTAYERIIGSMSWRLTQPFRSAAAAARRLSQVLLRDKK
jgi:peptidoglycan hydrolase CwlO-like protein